MSVLFLPKLGASKRFFAIVWMVALILQAAPLAHAQCPAGAWLPGEGLPGTNDMVFAITMWDPDGAGPSAPLWVVGGKFKLCGDVPANYIATFNPATGQWSALGSGMNNWVLSLTTLPNGELIAGGYFTTAGGVTARRIARWNGTTWSALGAGIQGGSQAVVYALTSLPNGQLIAGGIFSLAGTVSVMNVAKWNETTWSAMGNGLGPASYPVMTLKTLSNGDVVAGGSFESSGTGANAIVLNQVARWNGTAWSAMASGVGATVYSLAELPNGDIAAAGTRYGIGGPPVYCPIFRWNGTNWSPMGNETFFYIYSLLVLPNGDLLAGSDASIFQWNGANWNNLTGLELEPGGSLVWTMMAAPSGDLVIGGDLWNINGIPITNIARRVDGNWLPLANGTDGQVLAVTELHDGDIIAAGSFTTFGDIAANGIVKGDGSIWTPLGVGLGGQAHSVLALAVLPNGNLIAAGTFTIAGGASANRIAQWDGATWSPVGGGLNNTVRAVIARSDGTIIAGGDFSAAGGVPCSRVARWDGTSWSAMGLGLNNIVNALATLPGGQVVAGGNFTTAGGVLASHIAIWNGANWSALGSGTNSSVASLATQSDGQLIVGGAFTSAGEISANKIARWNGSTWSSLGYGSEIGSISAIAALPNGNVVIGGGFWTTGGAPANGLAIRIGQVWGPIGTGLDSISSNDPSVSALKTLPNGDILVGGRFSMAGSLPNAYFGRFHQDGWPDISHHPADATTCTLGSTAFNVSATGPGPLTYRWQMLDANSPYVWLNIVEGPISNGGQAIGIAGGTTTPTLTIIAAIDSGNEIEARFRCIVSNACASPASSVAALHVLPWGTGDGDANGVLDGRDILPFVNILTMGGGPGTGNCAVDMDFSGTVDSADLPQFIEALLIGS